MIKRLGSLSGRTWLMGVSVIALVERILLYLVYRPVSYHDTASYFRSAQAILNGWGGYDGTRTPGYPLFMALFGTDERIYAAQLFLGFVTTLLLFHITWKISGRSWLAGLVALAHTLNPQQVFFEANLLTESLTTFSIILSLAFLVGMLYSKNPRLWKIMGLAILAGAAAGWAALTRLLFFFLPVWMAFFLLVFWHTKPMYRWGGALLIVLSGVAVIGVWVNFVNQHYHMLGMSTMTGFNLVQHTGLYFEYVPDKYAVIRDIYLQYRAERIAATGSPGNAIWDAIPALMKATGYSFNDLSRVLAKISFQLIIEHPWLYIKNVILGWFWFWKAPIYYLADSFRYAWLGNVAKWVNYIWRGVLILTNIGFVGGSFLLLWKKSRRILRMDNFLWLLLGFLWITSVVQTVLDHGDNPRFEEPVQSLVMLVVVYWISQLIMHLRKKNENPAA